MSARLVGTALTLLTKAVHFDISGKDEECVYLDTRQ